MQRRSTLALVTASAALGLLAGPASALPTCTTPGTELVCGDRVIPEPLQSTNFLQFDGPAESIGGVLKAIEALPGASRYLQVMTMAEATGNATHVSAGGRPLWVVRVTDENVARTGKVQAAISLSVHALEPAGREGGARYIEDLARWATTEPTHPLYSGDVAKPVSEVLAKTEVWIGFTNSDGWAAGDLDSTDPGPGFVRANDKGADLNRDLATVGWYDRTGSRGVAESESETRAWTTIVKSLPNLKTSADIHGELTTPNDAVSDLIIPAGQWTPRRQEQVDQFSRRMIKTVERKFADDGVVLSNLFPFLPDTGSTPTKAANVAAAYDIVGYDDSGFMGDWFSQTQDSVHMDIEYFLSNLVPNNAWSGVVEQAHVAGARGNIEATIVEALITDQVKATADLGRIAYVGDPNRTTSADGTGTSVVPGETQKPYDVSRLDYFPELAKAFGATIDEVSAADIAAGKDLSGYDTVVVADMELPAGSTVSKLVYVKALDGFAKAGGQVLLTDKGLGLLDDLGIVEDSALTVDRTNAGHVDFLAPLGDHPYETGLVGLPSQTYYEVMLGYPPDVVGSKGPFAPDYGVTRTAWEAAGGTTVATVGPQGGASPNTALGQLDRGKGRIAVFGAVLPQAVETLAEAGAPDLDAPHPFGLASYALTITGGQVLDNILSFRRTGAAAVVPPAVPTGSVKGGLAATGLATTGAALGMLVLGGALVLRRRRLA